MGKSQYMRETGIAATAMSLKQACPYDATRIVLIITSNQANQFVQASTNPNVPNANAPFMTGGVNAVPFVLTKQQHGILVNQAWYVGTSGLGIGNNVTIFEVFEFDSPDRAKDDSPAPLDLPGATAIPTDAEAADPTHELLLQLAAARAQLQECCQ